MQNINKKIKKNINKLVKRIQMHNKNNEVVVIGLIIAFIFYINVYNNSDTSKIFVTAILLTLMINWFINDIYVSFIFAILLTVLIELFQLETFIIREKYENLDDVKKALDRLDSSIEKDDEDEDEDDVKSDETKEPLAFNADDDGDGGDDLDDNNNDFDNEDLDVIDDEDETEADTSKPIKNKKSLEKMTPYQAQRAAAKMQRTIEKMQSTIEHLAPTINRGQKIMEMMSKFQ